MKSFVVIVSAALLLASCSSSSPQKSVEECWHNLNRGHYKNAVELFLTTPDEEAVLRETFASRVSKIKQRQVELPTLRFSRTISRPTAPRLAPQSPLATVRRLSRSTASC